MVFISLEGIEDLLDRMFEMILQRFVFLFEFLRLLHKFAYPKLESLHIVYFLIFQQLHPQLVVLLFIFS